MTFEKLDKVKEKSAEKLYQAIQASKENSVEKLILAWVSVMLAQRQQIIAENLSNLTNISTCIN